MSAQLRPESPWGRSVTETQQIPNLLDGGSNPPGLAHASLAQSAEQETLNLGVTGSNPVGGTVEFDSEARVIRRKPRRDYKDIILSIGHVAVYFGGLMLFAQFLREDITLPSIPEAGGPIVQEVRIVENLTVASPTATRVACEVGITIGTDCFYQYPPTPLPVCPPPTSGMCVYDGPDSLMTPTPRPVPEAQYVGPGMSTPTGTR
jgi:hypothetical protein